MGRKALLFEILRIFFRLWVYITTCSYVTNLLVPASSTNKLLQFLQTKPWQYVTCHVITCHYVFPFSTVYCTKLEEWISIRFKFLCIYIFVTFLFMLKSNLLKCMSHPRFWVPFLEGGYLAEKMSTSSQTTVVVQLRMREILADMMRMLGIILGRERVSQCQTGADWSLRPQYCAVIGQKSAAGHLPPSKGWPSPASLARCRSEQWVADY